MRDRRIGVVITLARKGSRLKDCMSAPNHWLSMTDLHEEHTQCKSKIYRKKVRRMLLQTGQEENERIPTAPTIASGNFVHPIRHKE
jgi:hypothetical protein